MKKLIAIHYLILASSVRGVLDEIAPGKAFAARADELGLVARGAARELNASEHSLPLAERAAAQPEQHKLADQNTNDRADTGADDLASDDTAAVASQDTASDDNQIDAGADEDDLTGLTVAQLIEVAASEGVVLGKAKRRDDIMALIVGARAVKAPASEDDMI